MLGVDYKLIMNIFSPKNQIRLLPSFVFLSIWIFLVFPLLRPELQAILYLPYINRLSHSQKMEFTNGPLYRFWQEIEKNIPEDGTVYFSCPPESAISEKSNYYLYPRRVIFFNPQKMNLRDLPPGSFFVFYFTPETMKEDINGELGNIPSMKAITFTKYSGIYRMMRGSVND